MSYTPLKTINGQSIKGTGDLTVTGSGVSDGDYGDITVSSSGTVWTIDNSTVTEAKMSLADNTTNDVSTTKHGFAPKAPNDATKFLDGTGAYDTVKDSDLSTSDITTNDVSTTKHGFVPKAPNDTTKFLRGDATWAVPASTDPAGWTTIVKSANQDVTDNATPQDDTELQFSVVAGGHYMVEMNVCYSGNNANGDYACRFSIGTGVLNGYGIAIASDQTTPRIIAGTSASASIGSLNLVSLNIDFLNTLTLFYNFNPSVNATFKFQFANVSAAAGRTSRTWKGSILRYKRID